MMLYKILFYVLIALIALMLIVFGPRIYKGIKLKQDKVNTYAIQNVKTNRLMPDFKMTIKLFYIVLTTGSV